MADTTETLILDVKIDQADANKQLIQTEKNIEALRKESAALRKEYKDGKISEDEYIKSNLKLQQALKTETEQKSTLNKLINTESNSRDALRLKVSQLTKAYNAMDQSTVEGSKKAKDLAAQIKVLNERINKGSKEAGSFKDNIGNYADAFKSAGGPLGQHIGQLQEIGSVTSGISSKLGVAGIAATAVVGVFGALGSAYAASATGARDLERAQDLLGASTSILTNKFGDFIGTVEGMGAAEGSVAAALSVLDSFFGSTLASESAAQAAAIDLLRQLEITEAFVKGAAKDAERRAEDARRIRDDESKSLEERLSQTEKITKEFKNSQALQVGVINEQIEAIKKANVNYEKSRTIQLQIRQLEAERSDKMEEINGKLTENITAQRNLLKLIKEQNELEAGVAAANKRINTGPGIFNPVDSRSVSQAVLDAKSTADLGTEDQAFKEQQTQENIANAMSDGFELRLNMTEKFNADWVKFNDNAYKEDLENKRRAAELKAAIDQQTEEMSLSALQGLAGAVGAFFDQQSQTYKAAATAQTLISTYSAATKAYEAAFLPLPTVASPALGVAFAAAAVAQGLANVAQINGIQFAEGGYTGPGAKYDVAGIVHKGEYVAPQHVVNSPAAQPHLQVLENMRTRGYADGGFVTTESISATQQALIMANAIRNLPPAELSLVETARGLRRVAFRENSFTKL